MPLILAIEPDKRQAAQLKVLVKNRLRADLILADTTELALEAIGDRIPDLVLVPALLSPEEDGALAAALRVIATAAHVQTLTIPVFASSHARKAPARSGGLFAKLLTGKSEGAPEGCDPAVFGDQIAAYLAEGAANRATPDDEFADEPPAAPARSFARVETFAPADNFQGAIDDLRSAEVFAPANQKSGQPAPPDRPKPPAAIVRAPEPIARPPADVSILRKPDEAPTDRRSSVLDLFRPARKEQPVEPVEPDWPVYQPVAQAEEPAPEPAASDADNTDWAPPADQSIALDLPSPADGQPAAFAAAEEIVIQEADPVEEAVWAEHEATAEAAQPVPPTPWTPLSVGRPQAWPPIEGLAAEPAPADLVAEFTADLAAIPKPPKPKPVAAPPPKPKIAAQPPPRPLPPPKSQPAAGKPGPRPTEPPKQPLAAQPASRPTPAPKPQPPAPAAAASGSLKARSERPEWTALIDSLRQDMERMRTDRGGRSKPSAPPAPAPRPVEPTHQEVPVAAAAPTAAPATPTAPAAAADAAKKKKRAQQPTPVQDEWGFFDPQQCGFAALLAKLDEITENEDAGKPA